MQKSRLAKGKDGKVYNKNIGSPVASAQVIYDARAVALDIYKVAEAINKFSPEAKASAEIVPYAAGIDFPLVRVSAPVPFVVVVDEHPVVIEEIQEMADQAERDRKLSALQIAQLRGSNARLGISSSNNPTVETADRIVVYATTDLDPTNPSVLRILQMLEKLSQGIAFDCVSGEWLSRE